MRALAEKKQSIIQACESNIWLSDWIEYPAFDYDWGFREVETTEELKAILLEGNYSIRSCVLYKNLALVQQVNGGDEWLALKDEGGKYTTYESISFDALHSTQGEEKFNTYLNGLINKSIDEYWGRI